METGFFTQAHVNQLVAIKSLQAAKDLITKVIDTHLEAHPKTKPENVRKARAIVDKARSPVQLAFSVQNFIMAHPSEGLSVIK
jgi:hypothetical protein